MSLLLLLRNLASAPFSRSGEGTTGIVAPEPSSGAQETLHLSAAIATEPAKGVTTDERLTGVVEV